LSIEKNTSNPYFLYLSSLSQYKMELNIEKRENFIEKRGKEERKDRKR
jgi:hypothetical protein